MFTVLCYNYNESASWWEIDIDFKYILFDEGMIWDVNFNVGRVEVFVTIISLEPGDRPLPNLLLCSSNFADGKYLSFLVCGSHHLIVALLLV